MHVHNFLSRLANVDFTVDDPGDGESLPVATGGVIPLVTAGAETRTLPDPTHVGQVLALEMKTDGGDCVVTASSAVDQEGTTVMTFGDAGDAVVLIGVNDNGDLEWRVVAAEGVEFPTLSGMSLATVAAAEAGVPVVIQQAFTGSAAETHVFNANCPRKLRIIDAWVVLTAAGSSATTLKLDNGTNDITDALDIYNGGAIGDTDIVRAAEIDDDYHEITEGGTLDITISDTTDSPAGVVYVLAVPVA